MLTRKSVVRAGKGIVRAGKRYNNMNHMDKVHSLSNVEITKYFT